MRENELATEVLVKSIARNLNKINKLKEANTRMYEFLKFLMNDK